MTTASIAAISNTSATNVAFTAPEHQDMLGAILAGNQPTGFRWVMLSVQPPAANAVTTTQGLSADMTNSGAQVTFSQCYQDSCNPAVNNYAPCWFVEQYSAGEPGLTGTITLRTDATTAFGSVDILWEGETDRYGNGSNYYFKHGTTTGFDAPIVSTEGAQP
ncbi:MAG TPA: hypothetical protein VMJ10_21775 [Kofleriaceae bacterium]|nr:hypothetical protein [Kofleriaceae bacterium]